MKKKLISNYIYQASYQLLLIVLPLITVPIVSRAIGPSGVGIWNYVQSIANYFALVAGLGLKNYAVREIAYANDSKKSVSKKFWEIQLFNSFFSTIVLIIYIMFSFFMEHTSLFLLQSMVILGNLVDISWYFKGIEDFKKVTVSNVIVKVLSFLAILFLINDKNDIFKYVLIQSLSYLLSQLVFWFFIRGKIAWIKVSVIEVFSHFKPSLAFFVSSLSATIIENLNKTFLGLFSTMAMVGYFSNSYILISMAGTIVTTLNIVLIPRMSSLYKSNQENEMIRLLEKTIDYQLFLSFAVCFGIITINEKFVYWFFGADFKDIIRYVPMMVIVLIFQVTSQGIANQYMIPKNFIKQMNISFIVATIISVILNVIFIPLFKIYGAIIAMLASQLFLAVDRLRLLYQTSNFSLDKYGVFVYIISGIIMYVFTGFLTKNLPNTVLSTIIQTLIGACIYLVVTAMLRKNPLISLLKRS